MEATFLQWNEVDIDELADLVVLAGRNQTQQSKPKTSQEIATWLEKISADKKSSVVVAYLDKRPVGWMMLLDNGEGLEINPGILGGHPIVIPSHDSALVRDALFKHARSWAAEAGYKQITVVTFIGDNQQEEPEREAWYRSQSFEVRLKYVDMICHLRGLKAGSNEYPRMPANIVVRPLAEAQETDLYDCYEAAFQSGDARFFFQQSDAERRDYFSSLGLPQARQDPASVIMKVDERLVGFVYVLPYGTANSHISCMCVHPEFQGRGFGRLLLQIVLYQANQLGQKTVTLGTETEMRAYKLYSQNGFQIIGGSIIYCLTL